MKTKYIVTTLIRVMLLILPVVIPVYAGQILTFNGIKFEAPEGWEVVPITEDISMYPPQQISPDIDGITLSVSKMPESAPKKTPLIWKYMESNFKTLGLSDYQVFEQKDTILAGRPAKVVVYSEQELGMKEHSRVYTVYLSAYDDEPIIVIRYSGALSAFDRFWSDARKMIDSVQLEK